MSSTLFRSIIPYLVGLAVATALYIYAGTIEFTRRGHELGPDVWPRLAILLMGVSCVWEIARRLIAGNRDATGFIEAFDREPHEDDKSPVYPRLLAGGVVLMAVYAVLVPYLGFLLGTFFFLAAFMYVGRFRDHRTVWLTSALVTVLCGVLFLRIAYVSLPRGVAPFDKVTDLFFLIPGL